MSDRRTYGTVKERARRPLLLENGIDDVLTAVSETGFALVRGALPEPDRRQLLAEASAASARFLEVPERVNGVHQRADQLSLRLGDPGCPAVKLLAANLRDLLRSGSGDHGIEAFDPTEARYMRYRSDTGGLGPHRDGMCYGLVVTVYTLTGSAEFTVFPDADGPVIRLLLQPGDLLLLRGPGFDGQRDGRRRHAVGPPLGGGERVSLTIRMVGRHGGHRRSDGWSPEAG